MNLKEVAQKRQSAIQDFEKGWQIIVPCLEEAYLRLQLNPSTLPGLLKNYSPEDLANYISPIFTPPTSPEEAKIQLLSDLVISLLFPEKKIDSIIWKALPEIEKAYNVVLRSGGGWSSDPSKSDQNKRKKAVLDWYRSNQARLSYLKETYLQDPALYEDGGGQEKRNFIARLVIKIVKKVASKELTFQKIDVHLKNLKMLKQPLRLEDL